MNMNPLLEVENLRTRFATPRGDLMAVDGVSFSMEEGETLAIVGESGSGKSVLVRSVMNILPSVARVDPGSTIRLSGQDLTALPPARLRHLYGVEMGMVFQDPMTALNPVKRIGVQLTDPLRLHLGMGRRQARTRAIELLEQVGIPEPARRFDRFPHELSGGMCQRVTIAIALACRPRLLIADEPTTALDVTVQKQILDLLQDLQRETGMGMILITHDLAAAAGRADRIGLMYAGRLVELASSIEFFEQARHPYAAALMASIPKMENPSHTPLRAIEGRPPDLLVPPPGCRFAPRCTQAQTRCLEEDPGQLVADREHRWSCHFPHGSPEGLAALRSNQEAGHTVAGLALTNVEEP